MEIKMGELARFEDIRIKMYPMDTQKHKEPHFHIILTEDEKYESRYN